MKNVLNSSSQLCCNDLRRSLHSQLDLSSGKTRAEGRLFTCLGQCSDSEQISILFRYTWNDYASSTPIDSDSCHLSLNMKVHVRNNTKAHPTRQEFKGENFTVFKKRKRFLIFRQIEITEIRICLCMKSK